MSKSPDHSSNEAADDLVKTALVENHRSSGLRSGEGSAAALADGRLLLLYSHFAGSRDHDAGDIAARISADGGQTWGERKVLFSRPEGALNVMGASLLRLADGRLGAVFSIKWRHSSCIPHWSFSRDEGVTWSPPIALSSEEEYLVVNNDRLIQLRDGTLVLPYARHDNLHQDDQTLRPAINGSCGLFYSRNGGDTWARSPHAIRHTPDCFHPPLFETQKTKKHPEVRQVMDTRFGVFQEPGVLELSDGRLLLYIRSMYAMYYCISDNVEAPWGGCRVLEGFNIPCSPQTIRRVPNSGRLVMLYNDRGTTAWGEPTFQWRTPLSVAASDDEGKTWHRLGALTDQCRNYCYFSLLFFGAGERFLITGYESAEAPQPGATPRRRNLASLRTWSGPTATLRENRAIRPLLSL